MNYVFPELAYYKREWIPQLKTTRRWIEDRKLVFVCSALNYAARECGGSKQAEEIKDLIASAIEGHRYVTDWPPVTHIASMAEERAYRLAWLDHMVKECEK